MIRFVFWKDMNRQYRSLVERVDGRTKKRNTRKKNVRETMEAYIK